MKYRKQHKDCAAIKTPCKVEALLPHYIHMYHQPGWLDDITNVMVDGIIENRDLNLCVGCRSNIFNAYTKLFYMLYKMEIL